MIRALFVLVIIMAACTATEKKTETAEIPIIVVPESPVADTRTKREAVKPRKPAPKPIEKPVEPEPVNPLADCKNIEAGTPKETVRAKMACISERLGIDQ